jgi:hypothetical protein
MAILKTMRIEMKEAIMMMMMMMMTISPQSSFKGVAEPSYHAELSHRSILK